MGISEGNEAEQKERVWGCFSAVQYTQFDTGVVRCCSSMCTNKYSESQSQLQYTNARVLYIKQNLHCGGSAVFNYLYTPVAVLSFTYIFFAMAEGKTEKIIQ